MTAGSADNMEALDRAMQLANLRHDLEEHTFYYEATAREKELPLGETARLAESKRRLIERVVMVAPLAAHIVRGSNIVYADSNDEYSREGPVTCFRVHEILRKTRRHPEARILLNGLAIPREELLAMYRMLTPNTNLEPLSRFTLYTLPRILLIGLAGGVVVGAWMGRQHTPEVWIDLRAALIGGGLAAAAISLLGQLTLSRNMAKTAPWNAALYNDVNLLLYRRDPALLYLARVEFMERNQFIKGGLNGRRYHERARAIESGDYVEGLRRRRERLLARSTRG
jgi:hypothetical protein